MNFSTFFSNLQEAPWYRSFLDPVIDQIGTKGNLLDIGTGSGKLIQIVASEKKIHCTGIDTNTEMLAQAKKKLKDFNVDLYKVTANQKLPFDNRSFQYITICSVLFHLNKEHRDEMLKEAQRILKKSGKIIVLTPNGKGNIIRLNTNYFSLKNLSIHIWFYATRSRARVWSKEKYLKHFSNKNNLIYTSQIVMNGFAKIEILEN